MSARTGSVAPSNYFAQVGSFAWVSLARLMRAPSHSRRAEARRNWARRSLWLTTGIGLAIIALMYMLDATEIGWMPPRGTAWLWPVRILTDFGKSAYVLWALAAMLVVIALLFPLARGTARPVLTGFGIRLLFIFFAVLLPVLAGEILKDMVGRGRPFVGGQANAFNFSHFAGTEAFASFPSGHATTAFAALVAIGAIFPQARALMWIYAVLIALSRVVVTAHFPSDAIAGAIVGAVGALLVRHWFATRRLGFAVDASGFVRPMPGPSVWHIIKAVAHRPYSA